MGSETGNRSSRYGSKRRRGETIKLDAEIDATDQLEFPNQHRAATKLGIHPDPRFWRALSIRPDQFLANNAPPKAASLKSLRCRRRSRFSCGKDANCRRWTRIRGVAVQDIVETNLCRNSFSLKPNELLRLNGLAGTRDVQF